MQHAPFEAVKEPINAHYKAILDWLNMENIGIVNAIGIESVEHLKQTDYPTQAYNFGKSL